MPSTIVTNLPTLPLATTAEALDQEAQILREIVRMQFANMRASAAGSFIVGLLYAAAAIMYLPLISVAGWVALLSAVSLGRFLLYRRFSKATLTTESASVWLRYATIGSACSGLAWGWAGVFLNSATHIEVELILVFLITSLGIVSIYSTAAHLPTFWAFCVPSCGLLGVTLIAHADGRISVLLGMAIMVVPFILTRFARTVRANAVETMRLRFENVKLVEQLTREKQIATNANDQKSRFLASASHDLRQPLHALGLFAASLKSRNLGATEADMLDGILRSHDAMSELFDALLDISKLDAGAVEMRVTDVSLERLFERLAPEFTAITAGRDVTLTFHRTTLWVESDPMLLERIVRNLISNAVRYTHTGRVVVGARRRAAGAVVVADDPNSRVTRPLPVSLLPHVEIQIFDTGIGIDAAQLDAIFDEFYQVGNPERDRQKGLGLGLPIVKRLSALLGHRVRVNSRLGHGSTFGIALPKGSDGKSKRYEKTVSQPIDKLAGHDIFANKLILVVDDELEIRVATAQLLESWNMRVMVAASAAEALGLLNVASQVPACILCDYRLRGGENGIAVIAAIREELSIDIPALLITGDTAPDRIAEAQRSGLSVLHKPIDGARLRRALAAMLVIAAKGGC